jgi:cell fate (sporulation/competence/biofilm development) regulator YlbF (YheA/YmcA/DUF963 family)
VDDIQDLLTSARALGAALAAHPTVCAYYAAQRAARADGNAQRLMRDYHAKLNQIQQFEAEQKPIEVADKQKLKSLEAEMAGNDALKALMRTQADYVALMAQVNGAIDGPLGELNTGEPQA